ncbi:hypothetical protein CQA49_00385 [Helicobacter sp. MIT 00-7814]|uniref:hypothetical protein n=1 Tax=unclassified Helicobacter TaxID=2593540 RepID=UPI000E1F2312|nr:MULTISPECIES: hypothetical protein [unclassified Helicobacter]RDU57155.1 hypothetical protein CQA49_00385 [Helicobacter sp. MIT 00-7814]RDU57707.1 hypothetical protein CQA37_00385 [Helicobacter sp. MIT 99-10781]
MKKALASLTLGSLLVASSASAVEININPFGYLTGMFNSQPSAFGFHVRSGAEFNFNRSGFYAGLGAIGAWNIPTGSGPSSSVGDISDAYLKYKRSTRDKDDKVRETLEAAVGRFNSDFIMNDWLDGNMQGIAARYSVSNRFDIYGAWVNSMLGTGYKKGQIGARNGTQLAGVTPYSQNYKNAFIGGEVLLGGFSFTDRSKWLIDAFGLFNSKLPGGVLVYNNQTPATVQSRNQNGSILAQGGITASLRINLAKNFNAKTTLRGLFQYGNTDSQDIQRTGEDISFLVWGDEKITIMNDFYVGFGAHYVGGREGAGGIWAITDSTRYYGNTLGLGSNMLTGVAPYFLNNTLTAYVYAGMDWKRVKIHALASFLDYQEYHLMAQGTVWNQANMSLEVGGGFVSYTANGGTWSPLTNTIASGRIGSSNNFLVFVRFAY